MTDEIFTRFLRETADHVMTIAHDDGLYRHLKFRHTGKCYSGYYWFDLITVPGALIFQGDGDSYVFSRMPDMFEFFRSPVGQINPHYWGEKLTSRRRDEAKSYDEDLFRQQVSEAVAEAMESGDLPGLADAVRRDVFEDGEIHYEQGARQALEDFKFYLDESDRYDYNKRPDFVFVDTYEWDLKTWDWWFLWACHAIVWGIAKYDGRSVPKPDAVEPAPATVGLPATVAERAEARDRARVGSRSLVTVNLPEGGESGA